jgi:hypothetical protein
MDRSSSSRRAIAFDQVTPSLRRTAQHSTRRWLDARSPWPSAIPGEWMEHLWSPAGATGGNRWQMGRARRRLKHADPQRASTHGNGSGAHGKEGVDGSSPSEGLEERPVNRVIWLWPSDARHECVAGWGTGFGDRYPFGQCVTDSGGRLTFCVSPSSQSL